MERKRWNKEELELIFNEIRDKVYREHPDWVMYRLVKSAQSVLPTHRRRNLPNITQVPKPLRARLAQAIPEWRLNGGPAVVVPPAIPARSEQEIIDEFTAKVMERVESYGVRILGKAATEMMKHPLIEALIQGQVEKAAAIFATQESTPKKHSPTIPSEDRQVKPKIMIIGLLPSQRGVYESRFPEFSFRFWKDEWPVLEPKIAGSDVIIVTKFVDHAADNKVKASGKRRIFISGGETSILETVNELRREFKEHGRLHT